jgi:hypothetical protein
LVIALNEAKIALFGHFLTAEGEGKGKSPLNPL